MARKQVDIKHMVRTISVSGQDGTTSAQEAEFHINQNYLFNGYELLSTHVLGTAPNGVNLLYIFAKYEDESPKKSKSE